MDFWTFISKVIEAVAWPGVVLFLVLKFRKQVKSLLDRLTEASFPGDISAKFGPAIKTAEEVAKEIPDPEPVAAHNVNRVVTESIVREKDSRALRNNPSGVIMESWQRVLAQAKELFEIHSPDDVAEINKNPPAPHILFRKLLEQRLITPEEMKLAEELRFIRDDVAHSQTKASPEDADRYIAFAEKLILTWIVRIASGQPRQ